MKSRLTETLDAGGIRSRYRAKNRESTTPDVMFRNQRCTSCAHSTKIYYTNTGYRLVCLLPENLKMLGLGKRKFDVLYKFGCNRRADRPRGVKQRIVDKHGRPFVPPVAFDRLLNRALGKVGYILWRQASIAERLKAKNLDSDGNWNMYYWQDKAWKKMQKLIADKTYDEVKAIDFAQHFYDNGPYAQIVHTHWGLKWRKSPLDGEINGMDRHSVVENI